VVADTESWEQKMASVLEEMSEVFSYVKNQNLGFTIPYALEGDERNYLPDFIVKVKVPGLSEMLNLIVEVSGEKRKDKMAKVETAKTLWVPAVNNYGAFGTSSTSYTTSGTPSSPTPNTPRHPSVSISTQTDTTPYSSYPPN
jgi:type III restriction enzyme